MYLHVWDSISTILKNEGMEFHCDFQYTQCVCCYGFPLGTPVRVDGLYLTWLYRIAYFLKYKILLRLLSKLCALSQEFVVPPYIANVMKFSCILGIWEFECFVKQCLLKFMKKRSKWSNPFRLIDLFLTKINIVIGFALWKLIWWID